MCGGKLLKTIVKIAAPIAGAAFAPEFLPAELAGALGTAGTAAVGAGLGSTGAGLAEGEGIGRSLKEGALAGGGTFIGSKLFGGDGIFSGGGGGGGASGSTAPSSSLMSATGTAGGGVGGPVSSAGAAAPGGVGGGTGASVGDFGATAGNFDKDIQQMLASFGSGGAGGGAAAPAAAAATKTSFGDVLSNPSSLGKFIKENPSIALSGAGLAANAIAGDKQLAGQKELAAQAAEFNKQGGELSQFLQSGNLPPGLKASINQAGAAAKAAIKSRYASMGMSGSSAEQQELSSVDQTMAVKGAEIATSLLSQGIQESGIAAKLYESIMSGQLEQDKELASGLANFGTALAGGAPSGGNITINAR